MITEKMMDAIAGQYVATINHLSTRAANLAANLVRAQEENAVLTAEIEALKERLPKATEIS